MGRRAKKAPVQTKKRPTLAKRFKCPFCANDDVVECTMKLREGTGSLNCRICDASFQMPIHHLHEPIDVFSEWLDACEAAEKGNTVASGDHDEQRYVEGEGRNNIPNGNDGEKTSAAYASLGLDDSDDDDSD
mmetsp:Transcript_9915/g.18642  ORF Transcript_9915/g.18642 Transcript_9915/m.18642 type:complete len:132 (+) Transcript_9915:117-512(+)